MRGLHERTHQCQVDGVAVILVVSNGRGAEADALDWSRSGDRAISTGGRQREPAGARPWLIRCLARSSCGVRVGERTVLDSRVVESHRLLPFCQAGTQDEGKLVVIQPFSLGIRCEDSVPLLVDPAVTNIHHLHGVGRLVGGRLAIRVRENSQ